jgi:galactokinase
MGAQEVKRFFQKTFGAPPARVVRAPGRLELLGNHTDYNAGLVMSLAVDKYVYIAASPRKDAQVELVSTSFWNAKPSTWIKSRKIPRRPGLIT